MIGSIIKRLILIINSMTKEFRIVFSDAGAILLFLIAVIIYPVVYSTAYKNNVLTDIPIAVVDMDQTPDSRALIQKVEGSKQLRIYAKANSLQSAKNMFWQQNVNGILLIPNDFSKKLLKNEQSSISIYCDASSFLIYKETLSGVLHGLNDFTSKLELHRLESAGISGHQAEFIQNPLQPEFRSLYNPSGAYASFVMPGIIILILQQTLLIGIGYVGGAAREDKAKNNKHAGLSRVGNVASTLIGRSFTYLIIYTFNCVFTMIMIHSWFGYNDKGSLLNLVIILLPFLLSVIFLGLAISTLFKRREHSIMFMVFFSPIIFFLSGVSWPLSSIPQILVGFAQIFPSSHAIPAILKLRNMGVSLDIIKPEISILYFQTLVYFILACLSHIFMSRKQKPSDSRF